MNQFRWPLKISDQRIGWKRSITRIFWASLKRYTRSPDMIRFNIRGAVRGAPTGFPALAPVAQRTEQQGEGRGGLTPARVIEVIPRIRLTPVFKHPLETALGKMGLR